MTVQVCLFGFLREYVSLLSLCFHISSSNAAESAVYYTSHTHTHTHTKMAQAVLDNQIVHYRSDKFDDI